MSGKKKKFHEKEAEEEKKSTAQEAEVVHTDPVIQDQTEASHAEEPPQSPGHMQDQQASQMQSQEQSQQSSQIHTQEQPASAELYAQLEAQLRTLRAESAKMQEELQKIRDRRCSLDRRLYRELLDSEVLGQIAACYVEAQGKKELYGVVRKFLEEHEEQCSGIRAELRAVRERSRSSGVSSLACAAGILSVAGIVYAAAGMAPGAVIVLFLVLIALSGYVWINAEKNARINGCAEYVLTVMEDMEDSKKL